MTKKSDLMAPETEPTDAELQTVMKEALGPSPGQKATIRHLDAPAIAGSRRSGA